jgi:tetratricopeptide (TPR) repeat protein
MNKTRLLVGVAVIVIGVLGVRFVLKRTASTPGVARDTNQVSKTDERIERAKLAVDQSPNKAAAYNQLAAAFMQKARESGDFSFNAQADGAITRSIEIEPDNYDALKLRAKLQLTYHRFREALETARRAQTVRDDDHDVWGQITDAYVELGDYPAAVTAAQKMIDLRPDSSAYARVSYLRALHGDTQGAIKAMNLAVKAANPNDPEAIAWCKVQLGGELMNAGKLPEAERQFDLALQTFPDHHLALEGKARARVAAGDLQGAIGIYELAQQKNKSADAALALGDLYARVDRKDEAQHQYEQFELLERENAKLENSWRHMINYWLDKDLHLEESLAIATREYESRKDIFTCDSLAWALFKNGRVGEARKMVDEALRSKSKDARINYHAGLICNALNLRSQAIRHLQLASVVNAAFDPSQVESAKRMLAEMGKV